MIPEARSDPFGFPMVRVPELEIFIHSLPLTKLQFETFLCDVLDKELSAAWYKEVLSLNPRVPIEGLTHENAWRAFITGIRADEADRFARWCGNGYRLPTAREWILIYNWALEQPFSLPQWQGKSKYANLRFELLYISLAGIVQESAKAQNLATALWMEGGVLEWVRERFSTDKPKACGLPDPRFYPVMKRPETSINAVNHGALADYPFGARIIFDPQVATRETIHDSASPFIP